MAFAKANGFKLYAFTPQDMSYPSTVKRSRFQEQLIQKQSGSVDRKPETSEKSSSSEEDDEDFGDREAETDANQELGWTKEEENISMKCLPSFCEIWTIYAIASRMGRRCHCPV